MKEFNIPVHTERFVNLYMEHGMPEGAPSFVVRDSQNGGGNSLRQ